LGKSAAALPTHMFVKLNDRDARREENIRTINIPAG
jgi:hypothetical protein